MKLIINKPIIQHKSETEVTIELFDESINDTLNLWYRFPNSYLEFFNEELADAYIVGLLLYAMKYKLDIETDLFVSDILLDKITKYLIPFLCQINPELSPINILAKTSAKIFNGKHSGTGISCGVDSLSTVIYHGKEELIESEKIDTLTLLNTGYFGLEEDNQEKYISYSKRSIDYCKEFGYEFFSLDTNLRSITNYVFLSAHTYLTCSSILLFQKYFRNYYYASGYSVYDFKPKFVDSAYYDIFLLDCISTRSLRFVSSCSIMSRVEKTRLITKHLNIMRYLYVCTNGDPMHNCSCCEKCQRTMLTLDVMGKNDLISLAFDKQLFDKNRISYYAYLLRHQSNPLYKEIIDELRKNKKTIPFLAYLHIWPTHLEFLEMREIIRYSRFGKMIYPFYSRIKNLL